MLMRVASLQRLRNDRIYLFFLVFISLFALTGCFERTAPPAPVVQLGARVGYQVGAITVGQQDTLFAISQRYNLALRDLIEINDIAPPYTINDGQRLKLPAPHEYTARAGDTLSQLSRMFSVSVDDLIDRNNLSPPYRLTVGQKLRINAPSSPSYQTVNRYRPQTSPTMPAVRPASVTVVPQEPTSSTAHAGKGFQWPVQGTILSGYGAKENGLYNDGINIAAARGTKVRAATGGRIMYVGDDLKGFGNLVLMRHDNGWITAYGHLDTIIVSRGERVAQGQTLGTVGTSGRVSKPQLHFEIRRGNKALNPQKHLPRI